MYFLVSCSVFVSIISTIYTDKVDIEDFIQSSRKFTAVVYQSIATKYSDNFVFSPFSVQTILALTNEGARDETREQLINGMFLPNSTVTIQNSFKSILENLDSNRDVELKNSNAVFANNGVSLNPSFKQAALEMYRAEFQNLDFADNVASADIINAWVDAQTNHKITNLLNSDDFADVSLLLINAIYFNAAWKKQFLKKHALSRIFYNYGSEASKVPFMSTSYSYNYYTDDELRASFIELPYKGDNLSMVIILPKSKNGLKDIETNVHAFYQTPPWGKVAIDLKIPKFNVESTYHFADILKVLGITKVFTQEAELDDISENGIFITDIVQKAFINVTETGTEATSATVSIVGLNAQEIVDVNHPFMYYIQKDGVILFSGRVNNIKQ